MQSKILRDAFVLLAVFGGIWLAFIYIPWFPEDTGIDFPIETEIELGEIIVDDLVHSDPQFRLIEDPVIDSAVWVISRRLIDSLGFTEYDYNIMVVRNEEVNAFALPGGNIVIFSGLIEFSTSPEEVAAVLAHEMGHVEHRHVVDRLIKELGLQVLFGVLSGGDAVVVSEISRTVTSTFFDRKQEKDADQFALDLMHRCQISPPALGTIFRRMESEYGAMDEFELLNTHPAINSRVKAAFEYELADDFISMPIELDWDHVQATLKN